MTSTPSFNQPVEPAIYAGRKQTSTNYVCPKCVVCGRQTTMTLNYEQFRNWVDNRLLIQNAFPDMSAEDREMLLTGTHSECWEEMFSGVEFQE